MYYYGKPNTNDVLAGRGNGSNQHPGNIFFRTLVSKKGARYSESSSTDKKLMISEIVAKIEESGDPPGRFLEKVHGTRDTWYLMNKKDVLKKTAQALREQQKQKQDTTSSGDKPRNITPSKTDLSKKKPQTLPPSTNAISVPIHRTSPPVAPPGPTAAPPPVTTPPVPTNGIPPPKKFKPSIDKNPNTEETGKNKDKSSTPNTGKTSRGSTETVETAGTKDYTQSNRSDAREMAEMVLMLRREISVLTKRVSTLEKNRNDRPNSYSHNLQETARESKMQSDKKMDNSPISTKGRRSLGPKQSLRSFSLALASSIRQEISTFDDAEDALFAILTKPVQQEQNRF